MKYLIALMFLFIFNVSTASENSIFGLWKTQDQRAKVKISSCPTNAEELCGIIVELRDPFDPETGEDKTDKLNSDPVLKNRKLLGLMNLTGFKTASQDPRHWTDGKIYSPREGETYSCEMSLIEPNTLEVRGYIGLPIFGKTQTWTRTTTDEKLQSFPDAE
ncbi:MAG: DUF2147 domain-containing protein [Candidatus Paracaedimonas acanthamoebae]|uniref:DUF2147 domain-containing protein n=1 Tax=Candidatus Paracaedimonas acanthamoebae TaxID=244581 RepID=A0A8J7Q086_9PROT|nr:DUF2147 domain-containing protein [Candidatus Paracaedimonas acanthamoebae]